MTSRRPFALAVFWGSLGLIVAMLLVLGVSQWQMAEEVDIESVGTRPAFSASASATPTPTPSASASPTPSPSETGPQLVAAPSRVRIPAIDVSTKIFPVALDENNAIEIPEDIRYVGWYELGVPPGVDRGSAVLVAHRDGVAQGHGVFYDLGNLTPGDKVYVKTTAGEDLPYKVVSREFILKKRLPYEELFAVDGDPRLTLISCGGYYDRNNGGYQDNVVVTAVPLFEPIPTEPIPAASPSDAASSSTSPTPSSSGYQTAEAAGSDQPVNVSAPETGTVVVDSAPVLLDGTPFR